MNISPIQTSILVVIITSIIILILIHKFVFRFDAALKLLKKYGVPFSSFSELDEHVMRTPSMMKKKKDVEIETKDEDVPKLELPTKIEAFVKKDVDFGSNATFTLGESSKQEEDKESFQFGDTESKDAFQFGDSDDKKDALFPSMSQKEIARKEINLEIVGSEDDVFEKPTFEFQRILGDSFTDTKKYEDKNDDDEEEEAITFVSKTEPQVSQDRSAADLYLLRELERYKVMKAQERRKVRNEELMRRHLEPFDKRTSSVVFESNDEDYHKRLPKLNMSAIQGHSSPIQREWACRFCNTKNSCDQDTCRACRSSNEVRQETCPACHFVSTKDASFCAVCGFAFSSKIRTPIVVVEEEEEKEDSVLLSRSVSLKGFVEEFELEEKKKVSMKTKTKSQNEDKENVTSKIGEIPFRSIMFDVQMERNDTPTAYDKTRRRRQLIGSGPCLTPSGHSIFKPAVDNVVSSSSKENETKKAPSTEKKKEVKDILAEMSVLWEQFPE